MDDEGARPSELWQYLLRVNTPVTWRERLSQRLLRSARKIDGRLYLGVSVQSTPALDEVTVALCLRAGMLHAERLIEEASRTQAIECLLRRIHPDLYDEAAHGKEQ